jgi:nocardicin N-oxygenase
MMGERSDGGARFPFVRNDPIDLSASLKRLAARGPVTAIELPSGPAWLVTGYDEVKAVQADPRFSRAGATRPGVSGFTAFMARYTTLFRMDPPEHTRLREIINRLFRPETTRRLTPTMAQIAEELAAAMLNAGPPVDLVAGFCDPFTARVTAALTGAPLSAVMAVRRMFDDPSMKIDTRPSADMVDRLRRLDSELQGALDRCRQQRRDDLLSELLFPAEATAPLSDADVLSALVTILISGVGTPGIVLSAGLGALLSNGDQARLLHRRPELVEGAVEEMLRFCPSVETDTPRLTSEPVTIGDVDLPVGCAVFTSLAAADRCPLEFSEPDRFDLTRSVNRHLAFGHGWHACPAASFARVELRVAVSTLFRCFPNMTLMADDGELRLRHPDAPSLALESLTVGW